MITKNPDTRRGVASLSEVPNRLSEIGTSLANTLHHLDVILDNLRGTGSVSTGNNTDPEQKNTVGLVGETEVRINMLDNFALQIQSRVNSLDSLIRGDELRVSGNDLTIGLDHSQSANRIAG